MSRCRERWLKTPSFTELRLQIDTLLHGHGQVMGAQEAALALLALRGCVAQDDAERLRQATAILRAAVEAESHLEAPRFDAFDHEPTPLIAAAAAWADYAQQLGTAADGCASRFERRRHDSVGKAGQRSLCRPPGLRAAGR